MSASAAAIIFAVVDRTIIAGDTNIGAALGLRVFEPV